MPNEIVDGAIIGAIAGGIGGGLAALALAVFRKRKPCPECGTLLQKFSLPANARQMFWGDRTCAKCGCEVDRRARPV